MYLGTTDEVADLNGRNDKLKDILDLSQKINITYLQEIILLGMNYYRTHCTIMMQIR